MSSWPTRARASWASPTPAPCGASKYDMPPDAFAKEVDRLWEQVRPLYLSLHAYVRTQAAREVRRDVVPANGPIPAHLLGNMWAQEWENIYPLVAPKDADPGFDLTEILKARKTEPKQMVRYGEGFFTSLGFAPLPRDVLGAVAVRQAARSRGGVPRQRLGRRHRRRPADQDVHRHHRRGLHAPSITSWATTSTSGPTTSSRFCSATAPMTASTRPSATRSRSR